METKFTEQESMAVINEMIARTRNNIREGSGTFMIYWGCLVAAAALLNIALIFILTAMSKNASLSFHIWWIMVPAWIGSFMLRYKVDRSAIVKTHIDHIISSVWLGFGIAIAIFQIGLFCLSYITNDQNYFLLINPVIMLIMGIGEFITAKASRFRPFLYGAIAMWIGSPACIFAGFFFSKIVVVQLIVLAVCMIVGFVVPGYSLNKKAKTHV